MILRLGLHLFYGSMSFSKDDDNWLTLCTVARHHRSLESVQVLFILFTDKARGSSLRKKV